MNIKMNNHQLVEAVRRTRTRQIQEAIDSGANVNGFDELGKTPLIYAAEKSKDEIVQILLNNGANPNLQGNGISPIHLGVWDSNTLTGLIKAGADVNAKVDQSKCPNKTWWGRTALMQAADMSCHYSFDEQRIIQILIKNKADLDIREFYGNTALMLAEYKENTKVVELLLNAGASDVGMDGVALLKASQSNHVPQVESLIGVVNDVDQVRNFNGRTALHLAVPNGNLEIMNLLISAGASTEVSDLTGHTPLISAVLSGQINAVELLLDKGANPNIEDDISRNSLKCVQSSRATESERLKMQKLLKENGAVD